MRGTSARRIAPTTSPPIVSTATGCVLRELTTDFFYFVPPLFFLRRAAAREKFWSTAHGKSEAGGVDDHCEDIGFDDMVLRAHEQIPSQLPIRLGGADRTQSL